MSVLPRQLFLLPPLKLFCLSSNLFPRVTTDLGKLRGKLPTAVNSNEISYSVGAGSAMPSQARLLLCLEVAGAEWLTGNQNPPCPTQPFTLGPLTPAAATRCVLLSGTRFPVDIVLPLPGTRVSPRSRVVRLAHRSFAFQRKTSARQQWYLPALQGSW